jgi:cholesterol transport system auxiliary component
MISRFALLFVLLLSACSIGKHPTTQLYVLKSTVAPVQGCAIAATLQINEPTTGPGLETRRFAVFDTNAHLDYYTGAAWAAPVPQLLQAFLLEAFEQSHALRTVASDTDGVASDMLLLTDVRDFQVRNAAAPVVQVRLVAKLVRASDHEILLTLPVEKTVTPAANHMPQIVDAFSRAMSGAAEDIIAHVRKAVPDCALPPSAPAS